MNKEKRIDHLKLSRQEEAFEKRLRRKLTSWKKTSPWPGILLCAVLTWLASIIHQLPFRPLTLSDGRHPISVEVLALILGIVAGNTFFRAAEIKRGMDVVIKIILPIGIVLLGVRLDFYDLIRVGFRALLIAVITIAAVIILTQLITRAMGVGEKLGLLMGVGTAVCGTSAILVTAPVIEAEENDVTFSVASINLFGVLVMIAFPILAAIVKMDAELFGIWCGLSIHATPQVIAAGFAHYLDGQSSGELATIVKLTRVSLLGPSVFLLGALYAFHRRKHEPFVKHQEINYFKLMPTFILLFIGMALLRTLGFIPQVTLHMSERFILGQGNYTVDLVSFLGELSRWLITGALTAVGFNTKLWAMKALGVKPLILGSASTVVIALTGLVLAKLVVA